jgi:hypothetical protein
MKATKFIVLVGGILGILAFFLPLVSVERGGAKASVSAYQVIKGLDAVEVAVDEAGAKSSYEVATAASAKKDIGAMKGIAMTIFAPALLLSLIGGAGVARKRFGRVAGTFSLLFGIAGLGIAGLLESAAEGDSGIGLTMLLLTGVAGVVGGLIALVKPERLVAVKPALAAVGTDTRIAA